MTIDCSATAFVIRLGWILHLNHFIIYVPNSCQCHLEAVWLVIHQTLSFTLVINIVMGWTFNMKLPGGIRISSGRVKLLKTGVNRRKIIRCTRYQAGSPEMLLACPLSAIYLSLLHSSAPSSHSSLYLHTWPCLEKYRMLFFHCPFSIRASITTCQSHTSAASRHALKLTVPRQDTVETTTSVDEKKKKW